LTETISPKYLFSNYLWVTGTSKTAKIYSQEFFKNIIQRCNQEQLFIVEVASNDGTFLKPFLEQGHRVLGVDPAQNLATIAETAGIDTLTDFFGLEIARSVTRMNGYADVVIARNVLPHVPDPNDVVAGMAHCLKENGVGAIEFHWIDKILSELHYDSIYHEHYFYHSLQSIEKLLVRHSLILFDVTASPISGGSLVAYFSKSKRPESPELSEKLAWEKRQGLATLQSWHKFATFSQEHRIKLNEMVKSEIKAGKKIIGYGASARSSTLLNFCGIDHNQLVCIADQNPLKHNLYTPGTNILIVSPEKALAENPDSIILLAWNFKDEILKFLAEIGFHGNVILPLPSSPQLLRV
jgi:SAM-dependent methyltransferase